MSTERNDASQSASLSSACCLAELQPGAGNFYRIVIEAVADPFPPTISAVDLEADLRQQIEHLLARMQTLSEQEALEQVYRRLTLYLCPPATGSGSRTPPADKAILSRLASASCHPPTMPSTVR